MEDIKIIKQEVHGGEDIKKHTLGLIWKQSIGRMCGNGADLAAPLWPRNLGAYFSIDQIPMGVGQTSAAAPSNNSLNSKCTKAFMALH